MLLQMDENWARLTRKIRYRYKPANLNILHIAIRMGTDMYIDMDIELLDLLLAKNISPLNTDVAG
jgi:hypothetical protein